MTPRELACGHVLRAPSRIAVRPRRDVATESASACGSALGPTKRLPCTVGLTSTPLPAVVGTWKIVLENVGPNVGS